jgi:hypothetical protein
MLVFSLLALAHAPGFRPQGRTHVFDDVEVSQVEYRGPGTHAFVFTCGASDTVFWEVVTPWPTAYTPTVTADYATMADTAALSQSTTAGCPIKRYREGFSATQVGVATRFGSVACKPGTHTVTINSAGSVAFVIGDEEVLREIQLWKMPWYYLRIGLWAGWGNPWTLILVVVAITWAVYGWNAHLTILVVWITFLVLDVLRFWYTVAGSVDDVCDASPDNAAGPDGHSDSSGLSMAIGLFVARLVVHAVSLVLLYFHTLHKNRWAIAGVATGVAVAAWFLGVGCGVWPVLLIFYYLVDGPSKTKTYKKVPTKTLGF